jgi:hypothetical protein
LSDAEEVVPHGLRDPILYDVVSHLVRISPIPSRVKPQPTQQAKPPLSATGKEAVFARLRSDLLQSTHVIIRKRPCRQALVDEPTLLQYVATSTRKGFVGDGCEREPSIKSRSCVDFSRAHYSGLVYSGTEVTRHAAQAAPCATHPEAQFGFPSFPIKSQTNHPLSTFSISLC